MFAAHLRTGLVGLGYEVTLLRNGGEGLARAVTEPVPFDLVLVSAELPGANGFRICNRLKKDENLRATPVFLMSRDADGASEHGRLPTRADRYFVKPVVIDELGAQIRDVLSERQRSEVALDAPRASHTQQQIALILDLEARVHERDQTITKLTAELASARAAVIQARAVAKANVAASMPPPLPSRRPGPAEPAVTMSSNGAQEPAFDPKRAARLEKQLAAAHADRELANKRAHEAAARAEKVRAELATAKSALDAEKARLAGELSALRARLAVVEADQRLAKEIADDQAAAAATAEAELRALKAENAKLRAEGAARPPAMSISDAAAWGEVEHVAEEAERRELTARVGALEALVDSKGEDIANLHREIEVARAEVPALEAEIVVLRGELMSVRRELYQEQGKTEAAMDQLTRDREMVERARTLLDSEHDDFDQMLDGLLAKEPGSD